MTAQDLLEAAAVALFEIGLVAIVIALFSHAAPKAWVRARHNLALAGLWLLPVVFAFALRPTSEPFFESITDRPPQRTVETTTTPTPAAAPATGLPSALRLSAPPDSDAVGAAGLVTLWVLISIGLGLRLAADLIRLHAVWQRRDPDPLPVELSVPISVHRSPDVRTPVLIGYGYQTIAVPDDFAIDDDAHLLLEHEVAHAVRRDDWSELINRFILLLFWWVLPAYLLNTFVRRNREILCDMQAAEVTGAPQQLALALVNTAARRVRAPALALAVHPSRTMLALRVQHLIDASHTTRRSKGTYMRMSIVLPLLATGFFVGTPQVVAQAGSSVEADDDHLTAVKTTVFRDVDHALFRAARRGDTRRVATLLDEGADPNVRFPGDGTALIAAARSSDATAVELMLKAGANPNLGVQGDGTPLIAASARGHDDIVRALIQAGANIDAGIRMDGNPLIAAALRGRVTTVTLLLSLGANPDAYVYGDETPLINAAQSGHIDVAKILIKAGANPSLTVKTPNRGAEGYRSPLSEAQRNGHTRLVEWLRAQGAEHRP